MKISKVSLNLNLMDWGLITQTRQNAILTIKTISEYKIIDNLWLTFFKNEFDIFSRTICSTKAFRNSMIETWAISTEKLECSGVSLSSFMTREDALISSTRSTDSPKTWKQKKRKLLLLTLNNQCFLKISKDLIRKIKKDLSMSLIVWKIR